MTKVTFCLIGRAGCNIHFVWDDVGPGLYVQWSDKAELVGRIVREGDGTLPDKYFAHLTEVLA